MTNTITKTFTKRETEKSEGGDIGRLDLVTPANAFEGWTLNGKPLPVESVNAIISTYFFQTFSDAYAGETKLDDATAMFDKKVQAALEGTIGTRASGGGGVSLETSVARIVTRKLYKKSVDALTYKETITDVELSARNEFLDKVYENNIDKIKPQVEAEIEKRKAQAKAEAKLASSISFEV